MIIEYMFKVVKRNTDKCHCKFHNFNLKKIIRPYLFIFAKYQAQYT